MAGRAASQLLAKQHRLRQRSRMTPEVMTASTVEGDCGEVWPRRSGAVQLGAIPCGSLASELRSPWRGRRTTTRVQLGATTRPRRRSLRSRPRGFRRPRALRWQPSARVQGLEPRGANGARRESAVPEPCFRRRRAVVAARAICRSVRHGAGWPRCRSRSLTLAKSRSKVAHEPSDSSPTLPNL